MEFVLAKTEHLEQLCVITEQAKAQLKGMGVNQWQKGYPNREVWQQDIDENVSYVAVEGDTVMGAFMLLTSAEPSYAEIDGSWLTDTAYASLHRVCVSNHCKGSGVAGKMFDFAFAKAKELGFASMRIDTHPENRSMLSAISKAGFIRCGDIRIKGGSEDGDLRVAFEKIL